MNTAEITLFIVGMFTAAISATLGMAGGVILLSTLTVFMPMRDAIPIHGFAQLCSNIGRVSTYFRRINWSIAGRFSLLIFPGAYLGIRCVNVINANWLEILVAVVILWVIHGPKLKRSSKPSLNFFILLGFLSSFIGMIAGATGPLIAPFFTGIGLQKKEMVGTKAFCQSLVQFVKLPAFSLVGSFSVRDHMRLLLLFATASALGVWLGSKLIDRLSEQSLKIAIRWTVTVMALRMIFISTRVLFYS